MSELLTSLFPIAEQIKNMSQEELEDLGLTLEDVAMLEIITDPAEWAKYYLDWHARDYQREVLEQGAKQNRLVLRMGRRLGKCLPGWVEVYNPKTGEVHTVKELYEKQQATVASLVNYRMSISTTNTVVDNGVKPVYRVLLESGRYIDATDNHPLYRVDGWVEIKDLKVGDYVAVPNELPLELENELPLTPKEVKEIVIDFATSDDPSELMRLNKKQLKEALYFLFKTYGIQFGSEMHYQAKGHVVRRLQHLLLRIGLKSRIEKKDDLYVCITDFHDCLNGFSNQNEKIIEEELERLSKEGRESKIERYHPNDKIMVKTKRISKKRHIRSLYYADIHFEKIVSIERLGVHRTYDLSIEGVHNFIANDILVHNTETMCVLILWHAFTQINRDPTKKMSDPYDILILTPYEKQAVLIYDRLIELIEGSKEFKKSIKRKVFLRIELQNNTCIQLMTLGTDSGKGAANIRGQRADLLVYDEQVA